VTRSKNGYRLVGLASHEAGSPNLQTYTAISHFRTWLLTVTTLGRGVEKSASLTLQGNLAAGAEIQVYEGPQKDQGPSEIWKTCDVGSQVVLSTGAFILSAPTQGHADAVTALLKYQGCNASPKTKAGLTELDSQGQKVCQECTLTASAADLVRWHMEKSACSGGMPASLQDNGLQTWVCLRDWNQTEQIACGVSQGEHFCFATSSTLVSAPKRYTILGTAQGIGLTSACNPPAAGDE